ncbi:hypothetical protein [Streptomyces luteoverticillatus]|nr:hypothetical protein [Streptomyces luteoverticillatus]
MPPGQPGQPGRPGLPGLPAPPGAAAPGARAPGVVPVGDTPPRAAPAPPPPAPAPRAPAPPPRPRPRPGYPQGSAHHGVLKALNKKRVHGIPLVTLTLLITAPAVLAAALLRPRSAGARRR